MSRIAWRTVARSVRSPWTNSAFSLTQAGLPRRWVWGSRLSRMRTVQPSRRRRSVTCEPMRPAPPVTSARLSWFMDGKRRSCAPCTPDDGKGKRRLPPRNDSKPVAAAHPGTPAATPVRELQFARDKTLVSLRFTGHNRALFSSDEIFPPPWFVRPPGAGLPAVFRPRAEPRALQRRLRAADSRAGPILHGPGGDPRRIDRQRRAAPDAARGPRRPAPRTSRAGRRHAGRTGHELRLRRGGRAGR